ncbi:erythromycin esterase family protein [Nocardioides sp.]|uniref:erythromycin esterase family protein n=1 Tax=Nocardioides sp. TaxID=35761 RepID=UPI0027333F36|nr:erythromycin esterase family protein [Nocardioides sp.]MDP3892246.1 erythromycin esterase family protein [Nocardioides sp.]
MTTNSIETDRPDITDGFSTWLATQTRPLSLDPGDRPIAPPEALAQAEVVGLASAVRSARELVLATHVLLRALVERSGFRAVSIEGVDLSGPALDHFVRTGEGDPVALLAASQGFIRTHEALDVIRWLRSWAERHPDDPVSIVHDRGDVAAPTSLVEVEEALARRDLRWYDARGQQIVHWGGTAHVIAGDPRTIPPDLTHRNAGGIMRAELGDGYAVAALTIGSGSAPFPIPPPPSDYTEHALTGIGHDAALLELAALPEIAPRPAADWLDRPLRTRMIGPTYDPAEDRDARVDSGPLRGSVDALVHVPRVSAVRLL